MCVITGIKIASEPNRTKNKIFGHETKTHKQIKLDLLSSELVIYCVEQRCEKKQERLKHVLLTLPV